MTTPSTHGYAGEESAKLPGESDGGERSRAGGDKNSCSPSEPVFHVTEFDVTNEQYPESWEDYDGYIVPGGVASACGDEPWMLTLLREAKDLRDCGRPVLAFCLGHQVMAQALGGLVRPRTDPRKHYALQESKLLVEPAGSMAAEAILAAAEVVQRGKEGGCVHGGRGSEGEKGKGLPRMRLLYHHNDEVVKLPPGATNIATSRHCSIHGMMMTGSTDGEGPPRPNLLTFQAHPELHYEYGRRVMEGILDVDVETGRLSHEKARRLKEQVSAWNHADFPVALELMRQLFEPIVPRSNGGLRDCVANRTEG